MQFIYGNGRSQRFAGDGVSLAVRWLLVLSCVTCAVIDSNEATDAMPYLVYTSGSTIFRVSTDGSSTEVVLQSPGSVNKLGIDFDYRNGRLFWVDSTLLRIMSSSINGSNVQTIALSGGFLTLERLAYDWLTDKLYWTDYGAAQIGMIDLKTMTRMVILQTGRQQLSRPRAFRLDLKRRQMYWIDWLDESGSALIERASMDGSDRQVIVNTVRSRPYDLALDVEMGKIYIIDGYHDTISSMDLDGSNSQQLQLFPSSIVPFSLVYHDGVLYWTERRIRLISRLTVGDNEPRQLGNVSVMTRRPAGLVMISPDLQPDYENPCSASGCSHICILSSYDVRGFTCACGEGVELLEDQLTCKGTLTVAPTTTVTSPTIINPPPTSEPCPCMNGGDCRRQQGSKVQCLCPVDYTGDLCEKHINDTGVCDHPINAIQPLCENGATCVNTGVFEYHCDCRPGFEGRYCEKRINYGVCNETKPCYNGGVCINQDEDPGFTCKCPKGFTGYNCTFGSLEGTDPAVSSGVFVGVVAGFVAVVSVLLVVIICVFAMLKKQREKNKALEGSASSRSNSPMIKTKRMMYRSDETPSSTDTANHDYWLQSQPSIIRGQTNLYSQGPRRVPPNLRAYAKAESFDELSRESKVLTV
ncbi:Low-density lipoprotein receptor-related protein 1 [Geodia barretti]|uniref:Low-density lipoprotein receptor-related protein 1 n=1 Tax=Geodia barretti TaxID=519541 RepID=A0AA35RXU0_GEOBA|nr:Low-density lipoprotein receptor-related protein 1 [Geodia barretti]